MGYFSEPTEAARAYDKKLVQLRGTMGESQQLRALACQACRTAAWLLALLLHASQAGIQQCCNGVLTSAPCADNRRHTMRGFSTCRTLVRTCGPN